MLRVEVTDLEAFLWFDLFRKVTLEVGLLISKDWIYQC